MPVVGVEAALFKKSRSESMFSARSFCSKFFECRAEAKVFKSGDELRLVLRERLKHLQIVRHGQDRNSISISHLLANVFDRAFANLLQVRDVGGLRIEHERDVVAWRGCRRWCFRDYDGAVFARFAPREWRIEEFDLLRLHRFQRCEVFGFEVGDVFAFFVFDDDVDVDEVGFDSDDIIVVLRLWRILCVRGEREQHKQQIRTLNHATPRISLCNLRSEFN